METDILDQWEALKRFFPTGWEAKAAELGALQRRRKIDSPETLLRVLLIHLASGKSLRTTAAYAREAGLCDVNDVALLHRFKAAESWFQWFAQALFATLPVTTATAGAGERFRLRLVDATLISEPGSTGSDWRLHFCYQPRTHLYDTCMITDSHVAESLQHFPVAPGDLIIADRGYCTRRNVMHALNGGGHVLIRYRNRGIVLHDPRGNRLALYNRLRHLGDGDIGDWNVRFVDPDTDKWVTGRLCAIRKHSLAAQKERQRVTYAASKKKRKLRPETLEQADYILLFTTVTRRHYKAEALLQLYRYRWQIELVFKRMKGLLALGHLPKQDETSCYSWLYGKLILALLVEHLERHANFISPWGYPI